MFKFLKEKIKSAVSGISKKIEEEGKAEEIEVSGAAEPEKREEAPPEEKHGKKGFFSAVTSLFRKKDEEKKAGPAAGEGPVAVQEGSSYAVPEPESFVEERPEEAPVAEPATEDERPALPEMEGPDAPAAVPEPVPEQEPATEEEKPAVPEVWTGIPAKEAAREKPLPEAPEAALKEEKRKAPPMPETKAVPAAPERRAAPEAGQERKKEGIPAPAGEKQGFFSALREKIMTTKISGQQFEDMFSEMEMALMENNVAVEVIDKIKHDLKEALVDQPIRRGRVEETVSVSLKDSIRGLFEDTFDLVSRIREKREKPYVIAFVGINGSGKTTSIAKMASSLREKGFGVVLAAADTFRAASIEQISLHGEKLGIKVVKHDYGADPAAVAFDAIRHAQAKGIDVVLIDTAGRMHSNADLVNEMKKIVRVAKPDLKIFVGESITGNDCVEQAKTFNDAVSIDGIILSKADVDEKGGAAVSVSYVTKKPILYIGTGQGYKDLRPFDVDVVMENLGLADG